MSRPASNKAPAPNRRPHFPLGGLGEFEYAVCAPPASPAAVGEARRWPTITMRRLCASVFFGLLLTGCLHHSYRGHQAVFNICSSDVVRASAETLAPGSSAMFKAQLKLQLNPQGLSRFQNFMRACEEETFELRVNDQLLLEAVGRGQPVGGPDVAFYTDTLDKAELLAASLNRK